MEWFQYFLVNIFFILLTAKSSNQRGFETIHQHKGYVRRSTRSVSGFHVDEISRRPDGGNGYSKFKDIQPLRRRIFKRQSDFVFPDNPDFIQDRYANSRGNPQFNQSPRQNSNLPGTDDDLINQVFQRPGTNENRNQKPNNQVNFGQNPWLQNLGNQQNNNNFGQNQPPTSTNFETNPWLRPDRPNNFGQNQQPNFGQNQQPNNFGQNQQPNFGQNQQPNFGQNQQPNFGQNQQPNINQNQTPNFGQNQQQSSTTPRPTPRPGCLVNCRIRTPEYNPICSSNGESYDNMSALNCVRACGINTEFVRYGRCPQPAMQNQ